MNTEDITLELQKEYFELVLRMDPAHETIRFSLAQVLKEMGQEVEANRFYEEGIAHVNRLWFPKLFIFGYVSVVIAACFYVFVVPWVWLSILVVLAGPAAWGFIRRNRHKWMPQIGFEQRAETLKYVDIVGELRVNEQCSMAGVAVAAAEGSVGDHIFFDRPQMDSDRKTIRLKALSNMKWSILLSIFAFASMLYIDTKFKPAIPFGRFIIIPMAMLCVPFMIHCIELISGIPFLSFYLAWGKLSGLQRGILGLIIVIISFVIIFIIGFTIAMQYAGLE